MKKRHFRESKNETVAYFSKPACSWDIIASAPSDSNHNSRLISSAYEWQSRQLSRRRPLIQEGRTILTQMVGVPVKRSHSNSVSKKIFFTDSHNIASVWSKSNLLQTPHISMSKQSSAHSKVIYSTIESKFEVMSIQSKDFTNNFMSRPF